MLRYLLKFPVSMNKKFFVYFYRGMKSKRVAKLEHKLAANIRATEHLVRQEVSKDLNFLRRLLNEVNLMKVKVKYLHTVIHFVLKL